MSGFDDLVVWQKSMALARSIYDLTVALPKEEKYGIISQIRRAVVSVPSNIAEGHGRSSSREFSRFLSISLGSLREVQTLLFLARDLGFADPSKELEQRGGRQDDLRPEEVIGSKRLSRPLPTADWRLPTADCKLPTANCKLPTANCKLS